MFVAPTLLIVVAFLRYSAATIFLVGPRWYLQCVRASLRRVSKQPVASESSP